MPDQKKPTEGLRPFFERFQATARPDADRLIELYAANVMVAGPSGAHVIESSALLGLMSKRRQILDGAGHRKTSLVGFEEAALTPRYSLVRAEWQWLFELAGGQRTTVTVPSTFLVDCSGDAPHILVYVVHDDVTAVLRQRGMVV